MAVKISKEDFINNVFDYEKNQEWSFKGEKPAIIDFYADWCMPCKMLSPVLEELSTEYEGKIDVFKVNTEEQQELAGAFGIQSIPTLLFIPMEGKPQMAQGALPKEALKEAIKDVMKVE